MSHQTMSNAPRNALRPALVTWVCHASSNNRPVPATSPTGKNKDDGSKVIHLQPVPTRGSQER